MVSNYIIHILTIMSLHPYDKWNRIEIEKANYFTVKGLSIVQVDIVK